MKMTKLQRAEALVKNNGVCMWNDERGGICKPCPKKIREYCNSPNIDFSCKQIKIIAQKYIDKKININPETTFDQLKKGDHFKNLDALDKNDIYIKLSDVQAIEITKGFIFNAYTPEWVRVKKINLKFTEETN